VPYRRKKLTFAISSSDEFLLKNAVVFEICERRDRQRDRQTIWYI